MGAPRHTVALALGYGLICHTLFACAIVAMAVGLYSGMQLGRGTLPPGWAWAGNAVLLAQFPLVHSFLLTRLGARTLEKMAPRRVARPLATTTYALVASAQLLALFLLWTPSGQVWWAAEGFPWAVLTALYVCSWLLLVRALKDAGLALQTGYLGWSAVARAKAPVYGGHATGGLFRHTRQPVYLGFTLILWTVPVWTPDQLMVALGLTLYCVLGPLLKERRYVRRYGDGFRDYQKRVPYWLPRLRPR